jgi:hypothetical protein
VLGEEWVFINPSTSSQSLTITSSNTATIVTIVPGSTIRVNALVASPSAPSDWVLNSLGNTVGPGSAVDNAIVRFDGTTGKLVQNSGVEVDDSGNIKMSYSSSALGRINYQAASGDKVFLLQTITSTNNYGIGVDSSNLVTFGSVSGADTWNVKAIQYASSGAVTLGPSSGPGAITHTLNSAGGGVPALMVNLVGSNECRIDLAHNGTRDWSITSSSGGTFNMYNGTSTAISVSADCYDVQLGHSSYRAFASSPFISGIYRNCHVAGTSGRNNRTDVNYTGGAIEVVSTPSTGQEVINFWTNDDGEGATTAAKQAGQVDSTGRWRIGATTGGNHTVYGTLSLGPTSSNTGPTPSGLTTFNDSSLSVHWRMFRLSATTIDHYISGTEYHIINASGGVKLTVGATSWAAISDERQKKNISSLEYGLNEVMQINPIRFDYNTDSSEEGKRIGFSAQNLRPIIPESVSEDVEMDVLSASSTELIPVLVKAIQELKAELDVAKARIEALENK